MKKIDEEFIEIKTEFRIIKRLVYIVLAALIALVLRLYWIYIVKTPIIVGNVVSGNLENITSATTLSIRGITISSSSIGIVVMLIVVVVFLSFYFYKKDKS